MIARSSPQQKSVSLLWRVVNLRPTGHAIRCAARRASLTCFTTLLTCLVRGAALSDRVTIRCKSRSRPKVARTVPERGLPTGQSAGNRCSIGVACWPCCKTSRCRAAQSSPLGRWQSTSEKAYQLLGSESLRQALDLSSESSQTRERYGYGPATCGRRLGRGRRQRSRDGIRAANSRTKSIIGPALVEAGVPFVNVFDFRRQGQNWDAHHKNFDQHKTLIVAARGSIAFLADRGPRRARLARHDVGRGDGRFGRTPKINENGGRDHWPDCYSVLLAGGGVNGGSCLGASDRTGLPRTIQ